MSEMPWMGGGRLLQNMFRIAILVYHCQHGISKPYPDNELFRMTDVQS